MPGKHLQHVAPAALILAAASALAGELERFPETGPPPVPIPHFPRPLDAFVFRNWGTIDHRVMARAIGAPPDAILELAGTMGLTYAPDLQAAWTRERLALTAIRRNWHILPYRQLLMLLGWTEEKLAFRLREDDFLWIKLGSLKPSCPELRWEPLDDSSRKRLDEIREVVVDTIGLSGLAGFERRQFFMEEIQARNQPLSARLPGDPLPGEISLDGPLNVILPAGIRRSDVPPELLEPANSFRWHLEQLMAIQGPTAVIPMRDSLPDGVAVELVIEPKGFTSHESHEIVVDDRRVAVRSAAPEGLALGLSRLKDRVEERAAPFLDRGIERRDPRFGLRLLYPYTGSYTDHLLDTVITEGYVLQISRLGVNALWLPVLLDRFDEAHPESIREIEGLRGEVRRAALHGVKIFLYLNEPRAKPAAWFEAKLDERGVAEDAFHARCTSSPETREWMARVTERIAREVPGLGGFFTISMSENLTSCWSHGGGKACPRCSVRAGPEVVAEANRALFEGARRGNPSARFIAWDWGWPDDWIPSIVEALPPGIDLMSVSEWGIPIERGGVKTTVGEYSISVPGPGARARRTWELARRSGRRAVAKIQASCTWELSAVPYIPVPRLVAEHVDRLSRETVDDLMLGWTLGGWPSPNIQVAAEWFFGPAPSVDAALQRVARRRFGKAGASVVEAWTGMGEAFSHFPFHGDLVYKAPLQLGPANLLHASRTGYRATMVGLPYDDLDGWRAIYPPHAFVECLKRVSSGWEESLASIRDDPSLSPRARRWLGEEKVVAVAAHLHFESVRLQAEFVRARDALSRDEGDADALLERIAMIVKDEIACATRLLDVLRVDSRIGYEPSNQYYYVPLDVVEKIINCRWILDTWLPSERRRRA